MEWKGKKGGEGGYEMTMKAQALCQKKRGEAREKSRQGEHPNKGKKKRTRLSIRTIHHVAQCLRPSSEMVDVLLLRTV